RSAPRPGPIFPELFPPWPGLLAEGLVEPGPGVGPVAVGRPPGETQAGGGLLLRQTGEEAQLDQLGTRLILLRQPFQRLIDRDHVARRGIVPRRKAVQIPPPPLAAAFETLLVPGAVEEDAAHGLGGGGEEMPAAVPVPVLLAV